MRPYLKDGHVTLKRAYCSHCGDEFHYPAHLKPRPTYCEAHDPASPPQIRFDGYEQAVEPVGYSEPVSIATEPVLVAAVPLLRPANKGVYTPTVELEEPSGTGFAYSPKLRSAAEIRKEYQNRIEDVQCPPIIPITLPSPKHGSRIGINHLGDVHIGTDACTYDAWREMLQWVLTHDDEYLAMQGDMVDLLTSQSVGIMAEQSLTIQEQFTLATDDLLPLAKARKILWMLRGNHEDRLDKATKNIVDATQTMARHLDVRYLQTEGYTQIQAAGASYLSYNIHGFPSGNKSGSRRNKMEGMLGKFPSADIITAGHTHQLDVVQIDEDVIDPSTRRRIHRARYGLFTGTFHSYMGYAADQGMGQGPLGCGRVEFDLETNTILPRVTPIRRTPSGYRMVLPSKP